MTFFCSLFYLKQKKSTKHRLPCLICFSFKVKWPSWKLNWCNLDCNVKSSLTPFYQQDLYFITKLDQYFSVSIDTYMLFGFSKLSQKQMTVPLKEIYMFACWIFHFLTIKILKWSGVAKKKKKSSTTDSVACLYFTAFGHVITYICVNKVCECYHTHNWLVSSIWGKSVSNIAMQCVPERGLRALLKWPGFGKWKIKVRIKLTVLLACMSVIGHNVYLMS